MTDDVPGANRADWMESAEAWYGFEDLDGQFWLSDDPEEAVLNAAPGEPIYVRVDLNGARIGGVVPAASEELNVGVLAAKVRELAVLAPAAPPAESEPGPDPPDPEASSGE